MNKKLTFYQIKHSDQLRKHIMSFSAQKILNKTWWKKCHMPNPIRKLFEEGLELRKKYGADEVCDFSLGKFVLLLHYYYFLISQAQHFLPQIILQKLW